MEHPASDSDVAEVETKASGSSQAPGIQNIRDCVPHHQV